MRQPTQQELQTLINGKWSPSAHWPLMCQPFRTHEPNPSNINDIFEGIAIAYTCGESIVVFDSNEVTDEDQLVEYFQLHEGITIPR